MKTPSSQLKLWARKSLLGNYGIVIGAQICIYAISMGVTMVLEVLMMVGMFAMILVSEEAMAAFTIVIVILVYAVIFMLQMMMMPGLNRVYLNLCSGRKAKIGDIFFAFKNRPGKFVLISLALLAVVLLVMAPLFVLTYAVGMTGNDMAFMGVFFVIYWLLLSVAMIYVNLTYGMFYFILIEEPDKPVLEILAESRRLMIGNRWRYFMLGLSFLGMILLGYLSLGIGFIWLMPYIICTNVHFYLDLKPAVEVEVYPPEWQQSGVQPPQWEQSGVQPPQWEQSGVQPPQWEQSGVQPPQWEQSRAEPEVMTDQSE